jgi:peptidyl-prolyl cis-trans isomerase A (cyclophilin A)
MDVIAATPYNPDMPNQVSRAAGGHVATIHGASRGLIAGTIVVALAVAGLVAAADERAPERFRVRLDTTKGAVVIDCVREWAPLGADRFYTLVTSGYYDDSAFFRVVTGKWAQFGISGRPEVAREWRTRTIPDDPFRESNTRGTVAFAFAARNGRATQVFINLVDNRAVNDKEPFVPFGRVVEGMEVVDALYNGYGESALGGIRAGKQDPLFEQGNAYLKGRFPLLDYIRAARVEQPRR